MVIDSLFLNEMVYLSASIVVVIASITLSKCKDCKTQCESDTKIVCAFDVHKKSYTLFPSKCAMNGYGKCHNVDFIQTPLKYCVKNHATEYRRGYHVEESCPTFCPEYYRPVCGASKLRDYVYRAFNNGCYLDMINCRGSEDFNGYVEVPLEFCPRHAMKNIFKEKIVVTNTRDYNDYF